MKSNVRKITKLLEKGDALFPRCLDDGKQGEKAEKKRHKLSERAVELYSRALALCREDVAAGVPDMDETRLTCLHRLCALLFRLGKQNEAGPLLAELYEDRTAYSGYALLTDCLGLYGSLLCNKGEYDRSAQVLDEMLSRVNAETSKGVWHDGGCPADSFAVCLGLGDAGRAFTYAEEGDGYSPDHFTRPIDLLKKMAERGMEVDQSDLLKAAYYAASQQLFLTCYDTVPAGNIGKVAEYLSDCMNAVKGRDVGLFLPAVMRLLALSLARDCRFADCADACRDTLEICATYSGETVRDDLGSLQNIEGDMNLLLGIMHYRASRTEDCIRYLEAAVAAYEADAQGRPLRKTGYAEAETEIMFLPASEKCAFACKYIALAKYSDRDSSSVDEILTTFGRGAGWLSETNTDDPYYLLFSSTYYQLMAQMAEKTDDEECAFRYRLNGERQGMDALSSLKKLMSDSARAKDYLYGITIRRRMALRLGLLEMYGDYTNYLLLVTQPPYSEVSHRDLARLRFEMGEYLRVMGRNEDAVTHFEEMRKHTFDENGKPYYPIERGSMYEFSLVSSASCLVKCGKMSQAIDTFRQFADMLCQDGSANVTTLAKIASLSRDVNLDSAECAGYFQEAAKAAEKNGDPLTAAELYNQEGICWYGASPSKAEDGEKERPESEQKRLELLYTSHEMNAFENGVKLLASCDGSDRRTLDLTPSLFSNLGECHARCENFNQAIACYHSAVTGFEKLFATEFFNGKPQKEQEPYVFQYGMCFKALADIYNELDNDPECMKALTKAIAVFERIDNKTVQNELAACLNARGVVHFRMGEFRENVEDATRAIDMKKNEDGGEINMAIMLKNRSDAYRELGDFRSMQSDLTESIGFLDKSELPDEMLSSFYGSHWFSMGVCQEGLNKIGRAADAYRKAAGYMDRSGEETGSDAYMKALCHFRRAICLCRRDEQEYYGALFEYNKAIKLIEKMPATRERNENLRQLLSSRGSLYEAFREIDLARADFSRAESLRSSSPSSAE